MKKNRILCTVFIFLLANLCLKAQKKQDLTPVKVEIALINDSYVNVSPQSFEIDAYMGSPKLTIPNTVFFNPYHEWLVDNPNLMFSDQKVRA